MNMFFAMKMTKKELFGSKNVERQIFQKNEMSKNPPVVINANVLF